MVWGVTPGKGGGNQRRWRRLEQGDVVLFSREGRVINSAELTCKLHNHALAIELWQVDPKGSTWEYIYFIQDLQPRDISYAFFNKWAGYKSNNVIQGFTVLDAEKSARVLEGLGVAEVTPEPAVSKKDYESALEGLDSFDAKHQGYVRKEQGYLRKLLFEDKRTGICGCCGELMPVDLLVAAHIKKRADCSNEEKRDLANVMPMCKFGCDDLFEHGYDRVVNGIVEVNSKKSMTEAVRAYTKKLAGRCCKYFTPSSALYFEWRSNH